MGLSRRLVLWGTAVLSLTAANGAFAQEVPEEGTEPPAKQEVAKRNHRAALGLALEWLSKHQAKDGRWSCDGFSGECRTNKCGGAGEAAFTPGVSGLAVLAFLGDGETHQSGPYKDHIKRGIRYLKSIQDSEGCFGPRTSKRFQYNHGCAALALAEAYGMSGSRLFKEPAQRGVDFVLKSQNPYLAWRYGVRDGDNDTSVTTWMTMVLKSAHLSQLEVDSTAFKGAVAWMDRMTDPKTGRVGYQKRGGPPKRYAAAGRRSPAKDSESLTAMGILVRVFAGQRPSESDVLRKSAKLVSAIPPRRDAEAAAVDLQYCYFGTLAMWQMSDLHWLPWKAAWLPTVLQKQRTEEGRDERGSWDPAGPWGPEGGRVAATALTCMSLECVSRYRRVFRK